MGKIFLYGDCHLNAGPSNVNRSLIQNSQGELLYLRHTNKILKAVELFWKAICADTIVVSGCPAVGIRYRFLKILHKKIVYIMHGNLEFENEINKLHLDERTIAAEQKNLALADKIVCVSEKYSKWIAEKYPQYAHKITFINNGLEISPRSSCEKERGSIAVSGGNRNIKNNKTVCKAAKELNAEGIPCTVYVFGRMYPDNEELDGYSCVKTVGHLEKDEYYQCLDKIQLFVVDSIVEPFGLVIGDALNCRCSMLLSDHVGAGSILTLQEEDVVHCPRDVQEVKRKIQYLLEHPNAERLCGTVDVEQCSGRTAYLRLKKICEGR